MRNFLSFLALLIVLAAIGVGGWYGYKELSKDDAPPEVEACKNEKGMIEEAVKQANTRLADSGLTNPASYYTDDAKLTYYIWAGDAAPNFVVQPIGTPPC
jgi:hypothetical protein